MRDSGQDVQGERKRQPPQAELETPCIIQDSRFQVIETQLKLAGWRKKMYWFLGLKSIWEQLQAQLDLGAQMMLLGIFLSLTTL